MNDGNDADHRSRPPHPSKPHPPFPPSLRFVERPGSTEVETTWIADRHWSRERGREAWRAVWLEIEAWRRRRLGSEGRAPL